MLLTSLQRGRAVRSCMRSTYSSYTATRSSWVRWPARYASRSFRASCIRSMTCRGKTLARPTWLSSVVVYSVRMAGRPECVSGLLPHFAQGKAACASQVGFARELSFVGTVSWTLLTVRCRRDWHDFVENGLGGRLQLHFLQQLGEATFARLPPAGNLCHDTGEREFWQVQT